MKILVTGGTGFTGKALVMRLLQEGHEVRALDNKEGHKTDELREAGAEVIIGSVTEDDVVDRCVRGVEVVHHVAAAFRELNVPEKYYWDVNVEGTRKLLVAAKQHGVRRFIYCSTCGVHGNVENPPAPETAPIQPADYYQRTKYEAEPIVREFFEDGLSTVILRPAAIYGPGDPGRFLMIFRHVAKGRFPMFGDGKTFYHPVYIDNFVDSFLLCHEDGVGDGEAYLIADEEYVEIQDLVQRVGVAMDVDGEDSPVSRCFPSWSSGTCSRRCANLFESPRPSFHGVWTGTGKTGPSTSPRPRASSGMFRGWVSMKG